ncbi:TPA: hypothetical protein HA274_02965 [Candidatus Bathyarchaeota archaeon]|nr:hypothetical protein [Candidatus Bathyarchaeota archaeon]
MGLIEGSRKLAQRTMTWQSKDDVIAEKVFDFFSSRGFPSTKGLRGRGPGDYHYRKFESMVAGVKAVEIKVSRGGSSGWQTSAGGSIGGTIGGTIGNLSKALGPQRVKIEYILVQKEGGFLGKGKESKRFEFNLNADEYINDELRVKDEAVFQKLLSGHLKTLGFPTE